MNNMKKFAFTLAEVLIVIGIIGIIAALTIPALYNNYLKTVTVTRLKETYSLLNQAIKLSENDNGGVGVWNFATTDWFDKYLAKYLKSSKKYTYAELEKIKSITYYQISGNKETALNFTANRYLVSIHRLMNGTDIITFNRVLSSYSYLEKDLVVDINGVYSKPNQLGKDVFYFQLWNDYGLAPMGMYKTSECTPPDNPPNRDWYKKGCLGIYQYGCNMKGRGAYCAGLIMVDNWEIRSDYPW